MRRTISIGDAIDSLNDSQYIPLPGDYVGPDGDGSPLAGLLWSEVRRLERKARLTDWQASVVELHLQGISDADIGRAFPDEDGEPRTRQSVRDCRTLAFRKIGRLPHIGLLTVMVEELGWDQVRGHLAEILRSDSHQEFSN